MLSIYLSLIDSEDDRIKFEEIYYTYRKQMLFLAISLLHNQEDAEDVVHDVFLRIATKYMNTLRQIHDTDDIRNYLLKATKNTALNVIKKRAREAVVSDEVDELNSVAYKDISDEVFVETICQRMEYEQVLKALLSMEEPYRDILYYHFVLELSTPKAAELLGRKLDTAKKQLVRGKKMLLERLGEKGDKDYAVKQEQTE